MDWLDRDRRNHGQESAMGVIKRDNSKYWYIQFQFHGKTYIRSSHTTDKRAAEQMERDWRSKLHAQAFLGMKERITLREALDQYQQTKAGTPNHRNILNHVQVFNRMLRSNRYLDELTSEDLERLRRDRMLEGVGPAMLKHMFNALRGTWKYARKMGYQVSDLLYPEIKLPKYRLRYLSADEEKRLLYELNPYREAKFMQRYENRPPQVKKAQHDAYDLIVVLLDTGARYSEIADLEWSRIELESRTIHLWRSKVQNESILYMTDRVYAILSRRYDDRTGPHVFTNKRGDSRGYASISIRKAFRRAGLDDCTIHTLRHTHASRLVQNGLSIYEVKEILGHSDIKTTMRYAHLEQRDISSKARDVINQLNAVNQKPELRLVK